MRATLDARLRSPLGAFVIALLSTAIVACVCAVLFLVQRSHVPDTNQRIERLERLGSEVESVDGGQAAVENDSILLEARKKAQLTATWVLAPNDFPAVLPNSGECRMTVYVIGDDPRYLGSSHFAVTIGVNGAAARTFHFAAARASGSTFEHGLSTQPVFLSPLYQPSGIVAPLPASMCSAKSWTISVHLNSAAWEIGRVGVTAKFVPSKKPQPAGVLFAAAAILALLFLSLFVALFFAARYHGPVALVVAAVLIVVAMLTHDQWDFPVWLRFVDLNAFGHANPAIMWAGTPLWPYMTLIASPVVLASYGLFGSGSQEVTALVIKLLMVGSFLWTALLIARTARRPVRRLVFFAALLSPISLYAVAAGYRETIAGFLAVAALTLVIGRGRLIACILFAAAGSVSESLLPLILLPAALSLLSWRRGIRAILSTVMYFVVPVVLLLLEWTTVPPALIHSTIAFRAGNYRFGGASWQGVVHAYGLPIDWIAKHGILANVVLFGLLSLPLIVRYALILARNRNDRVGVAHVLTIFLGVELAFFLSYTGVDPSTWCALAAVTFFTFAFLGSFSLYPIVLSSVCALAFYAAVGLGDFVNWIYLWPVDVGLFGILGQQTYTLMGVANLVILAGWIVVVRGSLPSLCSKSSLLFGMLFVLTVAGATIRTYAPDLLVVGCVALIVLSLTQQMTKMQPQNAGIASRRFQYAIACLALLYALVEHQLGPSLVGVGVAALAFSGEVGLVDSAVAFGAMFVAGTLVGDGWLSELSILALVAFDCVAVYKAARANPALTRRFYTGLRYVRFYAAMVAFDMAGHRRTGLVALGYGTRIDERLTLGVGKDVWIGPYSVFQGTGSMEIGDRTYIGAYFSGNCSGNIVIGDACMFGNFVTIVDANHGMNVGEDMAAQPLVPVEVVIGRNCWIGEKATILPGVTIGEGAIVAAGAVVKHDVEPYAVVAGVPARTLRVRK